MNRTRMNAMQREFAQAATRDPRLADQMAMQKWGMSYADFDRSMQVISAVSRGNMPSAENLKWLYGEAKARYGWTPDTVRSELGRITSQPNPQSRIFAYLTAGGNQITEQIFSEVLDVVQTAQSQELEQGLTARVNERMERETAHKQSNVMEPSQRALDDAQSRQQIRGAIASHFRDVPQQDETFAQRRERVIKARLQLADRMDAEDADNMIRYANGQEPREKSLREQLSTSFDQEKVRAASIEYGFGDFSTQADQIVDTHAGHLQDGADITQQLTDI